MHNDWFQFTDISFPLLLISRMLSRIQPCISVIPIQEWNVSMHVCIIVSVEIEFYRSNQFLSPVTWLKSEYRAHVLWRRTRVLIENEKDTRGYEMEKFVTRKLLLTRKNCISNWKLIRRKRSLWKFRSNSTP